MKTVIDNENNRVGGGENYMNLLYHIDSEIAKNLTLPEKCKDSVIEHVDVVAILNELTTGLAVEFLKVFLTF